MRNRSLALADYPGEVVHISCESGGRAGNYRRDGLVGFSHLPSCAAESVPQPQINVLLAHLDVRKGPRAPL